MMQRCLIVFLIFVMDSALTQPGSRDSEHEDCLSSKDCEGNLLCTQIGKDIPTISTYCRKPCFVRIMPDPQEDVFCEANEYCEVDEVTYIDNWQIPGARQASLYIQG